MSNSLYGLFAKRYKATLGYVIFYGFVLAAVSFGIASILARYSPYLPFVVAEYIYNDMSGVMYVYVLTALALITLSMIFVPAILCVDGLSNNRWYLFYKMGLGTSRIVFNRLLLAVLASILSFTFGFVFMLGVGSFTLFSFSSADISLLVRLFAIAVMYLLCITVVPLAVTTSLSKKIIASLSVLVTGLVLLFYFYSCGFFDTSTPETFSASIHKLTSFGIPCLALITLVVLAAFLTWLFANSSKRAQVYVEDEIDEELLPELGIEKDMLVLEKGTHKFNVVISGPDVYGENRNIAIPKLAAEERYDDYDEPEEYEDDEEDTENEEADEKPVLSKKEAREEARLAKLAEKERLRAEKKAAKQNRRAKPSDEDEEADEDYEEE